MAREIGKLTALAVKNATARGYYGDGGGLYLRVSNSGAKSWVFRFKDDGKLREMGLGPLHTISLAEARQRAQDRLREVSGEGHQRDPWGGTLECHRAPGRLTRAARPARPPRRC